MEKLIPIADFVIEQNKKWNSEGALFKIVKYATFLKQPLTLGMFVPCDEDGNVLEEPQQYSDAKWDEQQVSDWGADCYEYQQAKERVLFKGFSVKKYKEGGDLSIVHDNEILHVFWKIFDDWKVAKDIKLIEDLIKYDLELTEFAIKQIGI